MYRRGVMTDDERYRKLLGRKVRTPFFDVEVPSLNGTLTWSLRTLDPGSAWAITARNNLAQAIQLQGRSPKAQTEAAVTSISGILRAITDAGKDVAAGVIDVDFLVVGDALLRGLARLPLRHGHLVAAMLVALAERVVQVGPPLGGVLISAVGATATVAADVCTRPCASVAGTRCTRCTPDSNFSRAKTPGPLIEAIQGLLQIFKGICHAESQIPFTEFTECRAGKRGDRVTGIH